MPTWVTENSNIIGDASQCVVTLLRQNSRRSPFEGYVDRLRNAGDEHWPPLFGDFSSMDESDTEVRAALAEVSRVGSNDALGKANAYLQLGRAYSDRNQYTSAIAAYGHSLQYFREAGDTVSQIRCLRAQGTSYSKCAEFVDALRKFDEALLLARSIARPDLEAALINRIAIVEARLGNYETALDLFQSALSLQRDTSDPAETATWLNNVAAVHVDKAKAHRAAGEMDKCVSEGAHAIQLLERALVLAKSHPDPAFEVYCMQTQSEAYRVIGELDLALRAAQRTVGQAATHGDRRLVGFTISGLGEIFSNLGQHRNALDSFQKALRIFDELQSHHERERLHLLLSEEYERAGNYVDALSHARERERIRDAIRGESVTRQARLLSERRKIEQSRSQAEEFRNLALTDPLTGLSNRRHLEERLSELSLDPYSKSSIVGLAILDLDHFKDINDNFSHSIGDEVLRGVGQILLSSCRGSDLVARLGGEEFVLLLCGTDFSAAKVVCERVRSTVESHDWSQFGTGLRVTTSIGLAEGAVGKSIEHLMQEADQLLYEAKRKGRNQIVVSGTEP